jgi:hypothetical protein
MKRLFFRLLCILVPISCQNNNIDNDFKAIFENLIYHNDFNTEFELKEETLKIIKGIHSKSLVFSASSKAGISLEKKGKLENQFTISFWFRPNFQEINGAMLGLYPNEDVNFDESILQLFINRDRVAFIQQNFDSRKVDLNSKKKYSKKYMGLKKIKKQQMYFLSYIYDSGIVKIYIDDKLYAIYDKIPLKKETHFCKIIIGKMRNKGIDDYFFNGEIDDLFIYDKALNYNELMELMDYTHIYQSLK